MSLCSKNVLLYANRTFIVFNELEALGRSFTYIEDNSSPRIDPCGNPHVTFCSFVLMSLLMQINCFLFVR